MRKYALLTTTIQHYKDKQLNVEDVGLCSR